MTEIAARLSTALEKSPRGQARREVRCAFVCAMLPLVALASGSHLAHGQVPGTRIDSETELRTFEGLRLGGSVGPVASTGFVFVSTTLGVGFQLFAGTRFKPIHELRLGVSLNHLPGEQSSKVPIVNPDVTLYTLYLEAYWAHELSSKVTLFYGPRFFAARATGTRFKFLFLKDALNGAGAGGVVGGFYPISERVTVETTLAVSGGWFYAGNASAGWLLQLRVGAVFDFNR